MQNEIKELRPLKGFYRTPFGFYVVDHKSYGKKTWFETSEYIQKEGEILIPNSFWSVVATMSKEDLEKIENPDIRKETKQAQELMLTQPAQFVNLFTIGNKYLVEPYGFGAKMLSEKLREGYIEVYNHDASKIKLGDKQGKYFNAKLRTDKTVKEYDNRFAIRNCLWDTGNRLFDVNLNCEPECSSFDIVGLGFRPEGNQAYFDIVSIKV